MLSPGLERATPLRAEALEEVLMELLSPGEALSVGFVLVPLLS
jgi:hypothetical protein